MPLSSTSAASETAASQEDPAEKAEEKQRMEGKPAPQESSPLASNPTLSEVVSELTSWKKSSQRRSMWTVNHVEGTKLRMSKRRSSYRPEDQEAFYRLLEDPVIQSFLEADIFLKVSDKYLLSMVVEYFGRVGLPGHLYNRIHFFLALYIASDMEEDNPTSKRSIFQFLLGREHWPDLYKEFLKLKVEFFHAMEHRAWVTPDLCEELPPPLPPPPQGLQAAVEGQHWASSSPQARRPWQPEPGVSKPASGTMAPQPSSGCQLTKALTPEYSERI
ncbi:putative speedy protein E7 [Lagenorhynchus albirostris]|uniref:putative speedy protein E7 n=1 Tax=Lagenorhynchus albirostris TaxID=27610 RepID=UPI0028EC2844|nr:putative speedy protein E7 [Lagenorhynchus albirostris]